MKKIFALVTFVIIVHACSSDVHAGKCGLHSFQTEIVACSHDEFKRNKQEALFKKTLKAMETTCVQAMDNEIRTQNYDINSSNKEAIDAVILAGKTAYTNQLNQILIYAPTIKDTVTKESDSFYQEFCKLEHETVKDARIAFYKFCMAIKNIIKPTNTNFD